MTASTRPPSVVGTVICACLVAVSALVLLTQLVVISPQLKIRFDEYGLQLPWLTKFVLGLGRWFHSYWWILVPLLMAVLALCVGGLAWLRHGLRYRAILLTALLVFPLFAVNTIVAFALFLPLVKLQEGLVK